jgi:transcriptional regulator with XRE-family HTH domain
MFARGMAQTEVAREIGSHTSDVSRIMSGRRALSASNRRTLARLFRCTEAVFLEPIDAPIPEPLMTRSKADQLPSLRERVYAVVEVLGPERIEAFLRFLASGSYKDLPADVVVRLREALKRWRASA